MRALVIGGCGFIGSHIVDRLLIEGHAVRVLDRRAEQFRPSLPVVEYIFGSFLDRMTLIEAMMGCDLVYHLASTTFPSTADLDPEADIQENLIGTVGILTTMVQLGVKRIVYLSSGGTIYGVHGTRAVTEAHPLLPIGSYGIVKLANERYIEMFKRNHGLSGVSIRASNPYGPRQGHSGVQGVVSTFMRRLLAGEKIEIWGDGSVVRDYFHVADLARLAVAAGTSTVDGAFNAGSGMGTSLLQLLELIAAATSRAITPVFLPARAVDVPHSVLDTSLARQTFGWTCSIPLQDGLAETWAWLRSI